MAQISLTFPDGNARSYDAGVTAADIAANISSSLRKKAISATVNGQHWDLQWPIEADSTIAINTMKDPVPALELVRHDLAHIMARAVQEIWPNTQVTIGPVIKDGWYYDFDRAEPFTPEDLATIEKKMKEIINKRDDVRTEIWDRQKAIQYYTDRSEPYKVELIESISGDEPLRMYWHGDWQDLCRGPHLQNTGQVPADGFKLMSIAGAYWRGDSNRQMLQRIYGVAFANKEDLKAHLHMLEEAAKRDHRKLGREMDLFHLQEEAHGSVFWHPKGYRIWRELEAYMRRKMDGAGYREIKTPQLMDVRQWEQSGHWGKYAENMFAVPDMVPEVDDSDAGAHPSVAKDADWMAIKPMNCPAHVLVFKQGITSYRDLPIRLGEMGCCHRNEPHGALHGLMRVRQFTQDDAHIFCTEKQVVEEVRAFCKLAADVYKDFGFGFAIKLALRPEKRLGSDADWDKAEQELRDAVEEAGMMSEEFGWEELEGEGAFYAPKLEWHLTDAIGRTWQVGTIQGDRVLPDRLDATYIGEDGDKHRPVMLHRAIFGSYERFIGILIEHFAGRLPVWLAPVQAVVATIVSDADDYAKEAVAKLEAAGIRVESDLRNEKINYKVREHSVGKVPAILVAGKREAEEGTLSVRRLGSQVQKTMALGDVVKALVEEATPPDLR